ncbi:MAG TPA: amino acid permease [Candidatus Methylomirabilis sp.]|jgi:amino acid transporter|nr:amino acid permease [Candidatus Methylomirabilis sp.]
MASSLKRLLLGDPLTTAQAKGERLGKVTGLAVFASDNLSSVAYATEEILLALALAGTAAFAYTLPIGAAIGLLMVVVATSYWQTVHAYPSGGGAYVVALHNLGRPAGLTAAAALMIDYVLTVAVSIAAGVAALTSAFPSLYPWRVSLAALCIVLIMVANLRGVRESGRLFAVPTYLFIASFFLLLIGGAVALGSRGDAAALPGGLPVTGGGSGTAGAASAVPLFILLRAFASGCAALTGVEAIANGVQAFRPPEARNAAITLAWMAAILLTLFLGVTYLATAFEVAPREGETVVSQIARAIFGRTIPYFLVQASTALILLLAANTSFAGFPRLTSVVAQDRFLPRQLANVGDRLVYSNGIVILGALAILLVAVFGADTHALIPLYAVGVFLSFTLSQAGMVRRWLKRRGPGWQRGVLINGVGAATTGVVLTVVAGTKFLEGAWLVVLLIPGIVLLFGKIRRHYLHVASQLTLEGFREEPPTGHTVLVLVAAMHRGVVTALHYAQAISSDVEAVTVSLDPAATERLRAQWREYAPDVPLVALDSPYRSVVQPIREYLEKVKGRSARHLVTVVLPEFVPGHWWEHLLHNQTALALKAVLLFSKRTVVTSVPHHLAR